VAEQLGQFLYEVHATEISSRGWELPSTLAPVTREAWFKRHARIKEKVYPLLLRHQVRWAEGLFHTALDDAAFFRYEPALIHGDLAPYHILFDSEKKTIAGVIDFGVAGIGDPALDVGSLITAYGERFVANMASAYPELEKQMPRARFYAQAIELEWVLLGLETGEMFWFTAHLGGARDVHA
jgi:aminoglycoside 2''-phosphotransferase